MTRGGFEGGFASGIPSKLQLLPAELGWTVELGWMVELGWTVELGWMVELGVDA